ncbi:MAG: KEOPS complex kinase/ATPase Bud32 [Candidatus Bathyarchaeia archaeon]
MATIDDKPRLIARGAEAELLLQRMWLDKEVLVKRRVAKRYRLPELDQSLREYRTIHEAEIVHRAKRTGVPTPIIYLVDVPKTTIYMEYVRGALIRSLLDELPREERRSLFHRIGVLVGRLHREGIIHGDLTTSNMILTAEGRIYFVDFGLAELSGEVEKRGVDLHLMKQMLISTHYRYAEECFQAFLEGYQEVMGEAAAEVVGKIEEIERRGRYVSERIEDGNG